MHPSQSTGPSLRGFMSGYHWLVEQGMGLVLCFVIDSKRVTCIHPATSKDYCNTGCTATVGSCILGSEALYCPLVHMLTRRGSINSGSSTKICFVTLSHEVDLWQRAVRRMFNPAYHCWLFALWIIALTRGTQLVVCQTQALSVRKWRCFTVKSWAFPSLSCKSQKYLNLCITEEPWPFCSYTLSLP